MGRQLDARGMPQPLPESLVAKLNENGIRTLAVGHTPHGNAPTLIQSDRLLVVMADTSYSDASAADSRGCAVSEVQFLESSVVRVRGSLHDSSEVSYSLPSASTPLVGRSLPAFEAPVVTGMPAEGRGGFSDAVLEQATLEKLGGKAYFVKAWLEEQQLYLLCNVDGFVVTYQMLGAHEVEALFRKASGQAEAVGAAPGVDAEHAPPAGSQDAIGKEPRAPGARWLSRMLRLAEADDRSEGSAPRWSSEASLVIASLGDADIIGLASESLSYAKSSLERQLTELSHLSVDEASESTVRSAKLFRQAKRLGAVFASTNAKSIARRLPSVGDRSSRSVARAGELQSSARSSVASHR